MGRHKQAEEDRVTAEVVRICSELTSIGRKQIETYKSEKKDIPFGRENYSMSDDEFITELRNPKSQAMADLISHPVVFQLVLLKGFWGMFSEISKNIRYATTAFALRPVLEMTYRYVIYYGREKNPAKQADKARKYHLLSVASAYLEERDEKFLKTYDAFLVSLDNESDIRRYKRIRNNGFQDNEIGSEMNNIFPRIRSNELIDSIRPYLKGIFGKQMNREQLDKFYNEFSQYVHANAYKMQFLPKQEKHKSHIYSYSALLLMCGLNVADFVNNELISVPQSVQRIRMAIEQLRPELSKFKTERITQNQSS